MLACTFSLPAAAAPQDAVIAQAVARPPAACAAFAPRDFAHRRAAERADRSPQALRTWLISARMIHELDIAETMAWAEARDRCLASAPRPVASLPPTD